MKIADKIERAKQAIAFITEHDDAPMEEITAAADELQLFAARELKAAAQRRHAKASAEGDTAA